MLAIDMFAGCGGLSLGLMQAGFRIGCAVEIDEVAAESYKANHPATPVLLRDVRDVSARELRSSVKQRTVDLIAGCAPCQGFCSLNKYEDTNGQNELVLTMGDLVREIGPTAVLMENVPGLIDQGKPIFESFLRRLARAGYLSTYGIVQMADYGVPQYRRRLVLVAGYGFRPMLPFPTHTKSLSGHTFQKPWVTVRDAIGALKGPVSLSTARRRGGPRRFNWHIVRDLQSQTKRRLRVAVPGKTWLDIDEHIRPECHRSEYKGFTNTYGRMSWDDVAPTITGGCTTAARGRFGHPDRRRYTISVREAAILQGFPRSYRFADDRIDRVCDMIGNAVPPLYARRVGESLLYQLRLRRNALAR